MITYCGYLTIAIPSGRETPLVADFKAKALKQTKAPNRLIQFHDRAALYEES
jgi:hypothetical protein